MFLESLSNVYLTKKARFSVLRADHKESFDQKPVQRRRTNSGTVPTQSYLLSMVVRREVFDLHLVVITPCPAVFVGLTGERASRTVDSDRCPSQPGRDERHVLTAFSPLSRRLAAVLGAASPDCG